MIFFSKKKKSKSIPKSWQGSTRVYSLGAKKTKKKQGRKFSRFLFWLLLIVFAMICMYLLLFSPFLEIDKILIEGNQDISSREIANAVEKSLEGKYFGYLPKKNFLLINKKNITETIRNDFSRLEVNSIEKKFPNSILVSIIERKAELVWCSGGVCYFVDRTGVIYNGTEKNEQELLADGFLVIVDDSAIPISIKESKIDPEYIQYIELADVMMKSDSRLKPTESYHTPGVASREIIVKTQEGWILKISSEFPVDEIRKIIQVLFDKELKDEARKNLDYLDLRVRGKIYYKFR